MKRISNIQSDIGRLVEKEIRNSVIISKSRFTADFCKSVDALTLKKLVTFFPLSFQFEGDSKSTDNTAMDRTMKLLAFMDVCVYIFILFANIFNF